MAIDKISTLSEFLCQAGAKYRIFDIGRRVCKISTEEFTQFELTASPYPYPFQRSAMFGLIFWHPKLQNKHYVWFLRFPLDEQGLLIQASRDEFLVMLLDRVGECMLAASEGKNLETALNDSPYAFKPREDKMAAFNAKSTNSLGLPPSSFFDAAKNYFEGQVDKNNWHDLAMQGIADLAVRLNSFPKTAKLQIFEHLFQLPSQPFDTLCQFLENTQPDTLLVDKFVESIEIELNREQPDVNVISSHLRAISNSEAKGLVEQSILKVLKHDCAKNIEVLATISGRAWFLLENPNTCRLFLERLAENDAEFEGFCHLLFDVMFIPGLRQPVLEAFRNPDRSEKLSRYIGQMLNQEN